MPIYRIIYALILSFLVVLPIVAQDEPLQIRTTTTIIADIVQQVGGEYVSVAALVPPDTDAHAFVPRPSDLQQLIEADFVFVNGVGLEGFLGDLLENLSNDPVVVSMGLPIRSFDADNARPVMGMLGQDLECDIHDQDDHGDDVESDDHSEEGECDPHVWGDPNNVILMAQNIANTLAEYDPDHAETFQQNAEDYIEQLQILDEELETLFAAIPQGQRILVTNHEFLGYFAAHYEFEIVGSILPGISTLAEPNPRELAALGDLMREQGVLAIFAENSDPAGLAAIVAEEVGEAVSVVTLYSGSLSDADGPAPTYLDYMRYNAHAIVDALMND